MNESATRPRETVCPPLPAAAASGWPALRDKIAAAVSDAGPVEVLRRAVELNVAWLLSNPRAPAALAVVAARGK
ncbi:MAG TPA: hypothetical protein VGF55_19525 [Gemmataceae bacterium]